MGDPLRGFPAATKAEAAARGASLKIATPALGQRWVAARVSLLRSGRDIALLTALGVSFALAAFVLLSPIAPPVRLDAEKARVEWVAPGSSPWIFGVRPGQEIDVWPVDAGAGGYDVLVGEVRFGIGLAGRSQVDVGTVIVASALLVGGFTFSRIGLPGAALAFGLAVGALLGPIAPAVGLPAAIPLVMLPPVASIAVLTRSALRDGALRVLAIIPAGLGCLAVLAAIGPEFGWPWSTIWAMPLVAVVVVCAAAALLNAAPLWRATRRLDLGKRVLVVLAECVPLARSSRLAASTEERARIATELHNDVLPKLGMAMLELDADADAGRRRLTEVAAEIRRSLGARQSHVLRDAGLHAALKSYVEALRGELPINFVDSRADFVDSHAVTRAPLAVELAAYRVAQAALANAVNHSGADAVFVNLDSSAKRLALEIADDGVGIDEVAADYALRHGHVGLAEMRAHAASVGAELTIATLPGGGTTVRLSWTA